MTELDIQRIETKVDQLLKEVSVLMDAVELLTLAASKLLEGSK